MLTFSYAPLTLLCCDTLYVGILWWFEYNMYIYLISQHHFSFYSHYMFRSLLDHLQAMHICQNYKTALIMHILHAYECQPDLVKIT
jgi:hypothetical protein